MPEEILSFKRFLRTDAFRYNGDQINFDGDIRQEGPRIPRRHVIFGQIMKETMVMKFGRRFGTLIHGQRWPLSYGLSPIDQSQVGGI